MREHLGQKLPRPAYGGANATRWTDNGELRYMVRSLFKFAPWFNHLYIVASFGQTPAWLKAHPKITVVQDTEIMPAEGLPTFASPSIESCVHRIKGLSEQFVYFCDDYFLNKPVSPEFFFVGDKLRAFLTKSWSARGVAKRKDGWKCGPKNSNRLLTERFGACGGRVYLEHVCYPLTKSLYEDAWEHWPKELHTTACNRFRSVDDIHTANFMIPHLGRHLGRAIDCRVRVATAGDVWRGETEFKLGCVNNQTRPEKVIQIYNKLPWAMEPCECEIV